MGSECHLVDVNGHQRSRLRLVLDVTRYQSEPILVMFSGTVRSEAWPRFRESLRQRRWKLQSPWQPPYRTWETVRIHRERADVFAYLADFERMSEWRKGVRHAYVVDGAPQVDAHVEEGGEASVDHRRLSLGTKSSRMTADDLATIVEWPSTTQRLRRSRTSPSRAARVDRGGRLVCEVPRADHLQGCGRPVRRGGRAARAVREPAHGPVEARRTDAQARRHLAWRSPGPPLRCRA